MDLPWAELLAPDAAWRKLPHADVTERILLREQREEAERALTSKGVRIGRVSGEPPISIWLPLLTGQEPDADSKIFCINPRHSDQNRPNMHVYDTHEPKVTCYTCKIQGKMLAVASMVLGIGEPELGRSGEFFVWRSHSSERAPVYELLHNLGLRPRAED